MSGLNTNRMITYRVPKAMEPEFTAWEAKARDAGLSLRDWIFRQVRLSLSPKPPSASPAATHITRGRQQGLMMGRLDSAFRGNQESAISVPWVLEWAASHPRDVADVTQWCAQQKYGDRFLRWWSLSVSPHLDSGSDRSRAGSR